MPYRSRITEPVRPAIESQKRDRDLFPVLFILWIPSVSRVVAALMHHETFRAQATLALIFAALIPCLAVWPWIERWRASAMSSALDARDARIWQDEKRR